MPDEENESIVQGTKPVAKKGGLKKILIIFAFVILLGGCGFFYWRYRSAAKAKTAETAQKSNSEKPAPVEGKEDTEVKEIIELQPFIVNLADRNETRYLRITISLGVGESAEAKPDPLFTTRVRNAVLAIITTKTSDQVLSVDGKADLRKEMLKAARAAVSQPEVHAIYITDFIVQM